MMNKENQCNGQYKKHLSGQLTSTCLSKAEAACGDREGGARDGGPSASISGSRRGMSWSEPRVAPVFPWQVRRAEN